ncbi:MAG TPA: BTAD domain-containing putative transcriptional regulator, partial [Candidatus Kapabacteria bacterium]|nr:BTAD domain-containing putative transcriptional regulator [Candidatus Kapabacteria bacterium]
QVRVLGRFYVEVNGKEITSEQWKRKRSRDIFKYMVLHYKQTLSVEKIVDIFWGYNAPENAVNIVWNAVSVIRSILEPDMPKGIPSSYIIAADKSYTLDFGDNGIIDCCEFLHYVTQAQRCTNEYESIELIEKALSYYGGDLLPEDIYEEWTHAIREDYKSHYILCCLQCSAFYAEVHNYDLSISYAKKIIAIDYTYRKAYEILVKVCKESGNINEAHRSIAQCKKQYIIEYGEAPPTWLDQLDFLLSDGV